jgi:hypothetical protein
MLRKVVAFLSALDLQKEFSKSRFDRGGYAFLICGSE